ncbi:hypothetical protein [Aliidiomarina quisquiliarum]|uniref:hypothetical protein n=1 Tax=Aliidiomarina quisquiliarum TaxID=2938947 RepID=UPI00208EE35D|nr:hypothetical protein [Aliidiomarina quisquiliarum]MCO4321672.1 hypothetical protein [Aliidiomarina quisquiliarum]
MLKTWLLSRQRGLTLLEILLTTGLVAMLSTALLSWHLHFQHSLHQSQQQQQTEQALQHWLHWLWRDLQNTLVASPHDWSYDTSNQCLLYGEVGVRVKSNNLQWRPQQATCDSPGWQALNNPQQIRIARLEITAQRLCLSARLRGQQQTKACLPWPV